MRRTWNGLLVVLVSLAVAGCGSDDRDAGPEVPVLTLPPEPVVEIGARESEGPTFTQVTGAVFLPDGGFAVSNVNAPPTIYAFDPDGGERWRVGRSGEGPGEFGMIFHLFLLEPDTLVAVDRTRSRVTWVTTNGEVAGSVLIDRYPHPRGPEMALAHMGLLSDGSFLGLHNFMGEVSEVVDGRLRTPLLRVAPDGRVLDDTVVVVPGIDVAPDGGMLLFRRSPVVAAAGDHALVGGADGFRVERVDTAGRVVGVFERPYEPRVVTSDLIAAAKRLALDRIPRDAPDAPARRRRIEGQYQDPTRRDTLPALQYGGLVADLPRELWVQHYLAPGDTAATWSVFAGDGTLKSEVVVPRAFRIMDVRPDAILGVWTDELDVQSVRVYRRDQ